MDMQHLGDDPLELIKQGKHLDLCRHGKSCGSEIYVCILHQDLELLLLESPVKDLAIKLDRVVEHAWRGPSNDVRQTCR